MPFRPQQLDTGFTAYQTVQPEAPKPPQAANPLVVAGQLAAAVVNPASAGQFIQQNFDAFQAGFRLENDILNTVDLLTRPTYQDDPTFDLASRLKADGLWNDYADNFLGVGSEAEYLAVSGRIAQEQRDRATLAAAGTAGIVAQMAAGFVSPVSLLPFVGQARGVRALALGAGLGFAGGVAQELPLQLAQETRTLSESVSSIALSTVLAGVLGGAVGFARRPVDELADVMRADMASAHGATTIPSLAPRPASVGAAARLEEAPELASAFGLEKTVGQVSPVVRVLNSGFGQARWMMAQIADAGLEFADKRIGAIGGNVENRIKTYYGPVEKVIRGLDDAYARYWFGEGANKPLAVKRATLAGLNPNRVKMSRKEFKEAVALALQSGDQHSVPEVAEVAAMMRREVYDPIFKRAQEAGIYKPLAEGDNETPGDVSYLNRVYNIERIQARQAEFESILASHYEQKLVDEFRAAWTALGEQQTRATERVEDFRRSPDEVARLREDFENRLKALNEGRDAELVELEDAISERRSAARAFDRGTPERESLLEEARALEQEGGEALAETRAARATIRRRLANLRRAHSALSARQEAKLDKIARAEELSFNTLQRLVRRGQKVLDELDTVSDTRLNAELSKLKTQFSEAARRYDKNEERIAQVFDDEFEGDVPTSPFVQAAKIETAAFDKMTEVAEAIEQVDVYDRAVARAAIEAGLDDAIKRAQSIVERRAVRSVRLADQAKNLDPKIAAKRIGQIEDDIRLRRTEFLDRWRERGADDIDPVTGVSNFKRYAADAARATTNKILGTYMRLPGMDILGMQRGPELARVLDIDSRLLVSEHGGSFLELDSEKLMMMYVRTLAPDIELMRSFGPDFLGKRDEVAGELNENWKKLDDEVNEVRDREQELMRQGVNPKTGRKQEYTQEQIDKRGQEIASEYRALRRDLEAVVGRLRHTWGVPPDPRGLGARAANIAGNLNVLRFMASVLISSFPDLGRPIKKYGLLRTFRDGYVPFLRSLAELKFSPRQLRIMGAALDVTLHSRAAQVYDIGDYMVRGSKFEKGLEWATSKIGLVAVFDYWTVAMKQIAGSVVNARAADAISIVAGGAKASQKDLEEAVRFLAANGVDDDLARRMWEQMQGAGGENVGGQWWTNTENWTDADAVTAYNAMMVREVDNTIITPGVERALVMDANPYNRLFFQFKSFGMSSTTKTFLAGAQAMRQGDMAFVTGGLISLALGTLSYYTASMLAGGPQRERMEAALAAGEWEKFADEAINRSGLLGLGADLQSAFAATPLAPYTTFSGERSTRRGGDNLLETLIGPTYGDLLPSAANITAGVGGSIESLLSTGEPALGEVPWNEVRRLAPLQNHFLLRQLYDRIEDAAGAFPERRE